MMETNKDYIDARSARLEEAIREEGQALEDLSKLKNEIYHKEHEVTLAKRIQANCLDDIAFLEVFGSNGTEYEIIYKFEDRGIEITKDWRLRNDH